MESAGFGGKKSLFLYKRLSILLLLPLLSCGCSGAFDEDDNNTSFVIAEESERVEQSEVSESEGESIDVSQEKNENLEAPQMKEWKNIAVKVQNGNLTGSGVIYQKSEDTLVVITAAHVVEQVQETSTITFFDNITVESENCYVSPDADLAFLKVASTSVPGENWNNYAAVYVNKDSFDAMQSGDEVMFVVADLKSERQQEKEGADIDTYGKGIILENWTFVEDFGQYMMLIRGNITPGMSGGGVFDTLGNFLGILCGANEKGDVAVVPLSIIQAQE